jgi:hypothetical protein
MNFMGNYRGKVLDNTGDKGRCKIYVPSLHSSEFENIPTKLPWAEPAMPLFGGTTDNQGMCSWPEVGATVWVFFEGGDLRDPVYFANIAGGQAWIAENNKQFVIQTEKTKLTIDDNTGEVTLIVATGINIETPITNINGELHVTGNIKGDAEVEDKTATMTQDRAIFDAHIHIAPQAPGGTLPTQPPTTTQS